MSFVIAAGAPLASEVRRVAGREIDEAVAILEAGRRRRDRGVHETRKRVKKLRGLLRLVRSLDAAHLKAEDRRLGELSRGLSAGRDATAMVESFERFEAEFPRSFALGALDQVKHRLVERRDRILREEQALDAAIEAAMAEFTSARAALDALSEPVGALAAAGVLADGLARTWRKARDAKRRAGKERLPEAFHDLRKATKAHFMHLSLLEPYWPRPFKPRRDGLKRLGDRLGELNDIDVMRAWLAGENGLEKDAVDGFVSVLARKEKRLRKECLALAETLFQQKPGPTVEKVAKAYAAMAAKREAGARKVLLAAE
jgi:CHAD domain-containing protein